MGSKLLRWGVSVAFLFTLQGEAQITTGTISGTVTDTTGGVLPGAKVVILNEDTGVSRTVAADEAGRYFAYSLPLGRYQVSATLEGFQTEVRRGIVLTVGRHAVVDMELAVGAVTQTVEVTGEAPMIETTSATIASLVDDKKIRALPLNGRDLIQLTTLNPGVIQARNTAGDYNSSYGTKISVAGARPTSNNFMIDGSDANDSRNRTPGSVAGVMLGVEAMREFSILTHNYSAEFGRAAGGVVNLVTKSGTNEFHGSVFEFYRNSALDARNFFDEEEPPPFKRNQFGFSFGGPIKKNQSFFFTSYEGLRDRLGFTNAIPVPTAEARNGILPGRPAFEVHPNIRPLLVFYPLPNGRDLGAGVAEHTYTASKPTNGNFFTARVDHRLSDNDSFFGRYTFDSGNRFAPEDDSRFFGNTERTRNQYATVEYTKIFSPTIINTARLGFNRSVSSRTETPFDIEASVHESLSLFPGKPLGDIRVTGTARPWGADAGLLPESGSLTTWDIVEDLSIRKGAHFIKTGVNIKRLQFNQLSPGRIGGRLRFSSLLNFLRGVPRQVEILFPGSTYDRYWRESVIGLYVQEDWKPLSNLTVNLGLRYEFITVPKEKQGRMANVIHPESDTSVTVVEQIFENPSLRNFAPRVGFAWDPTGGGKMVIRGGAGMFYDQILTLWLHTTGSRMPPFFRIIQVNNPPFPDLASVLSAGPRAGVLNTFPVNMNNPYMIRYNLNIQREMIPGTVFLVGYAGTRGIHVGRIADANMANPQVLDGRTFFPAGSPRRNPALGEIRTRSADVDSFYHSLILSLARRVQQGLNFQFSYTFSRSVDDGSGTQTAGDFITEGQQLNWSDHKMSRGLSAFHVAHAANFNTTYDLPVGAGMTGVAGALLKGWQLNGILTLATGSPFEVFMDAEVARDASSAGDERPDLRPGASNNPVLGGPDRYFDASAFAVPQPGRFGNLGRNTLIGPGFATVDIGLEKAIPIGENLSWRFRAEAFNLFNRANFQVPTENGRTVFGGNLQPVGGAGRITETTTSSRQIQFGLKLVF